MNEIIQGLEANATNGKENFCYISENMLNAIKELSKREYQEKQDLQSQLSQKEKKLNSIREFILNHKDLGIAAELDYFVIRNEALKILEEENK